LKYIFFKLNKYESFVTQKVPKVHFGMGKENGGKVIEGRKWKHDNLREEGESGGLDGRKGRKKIIKIY